MKINCLSLLLTFTLLISVFSVKADAVNTKRFYFEALDEDTTEEVREYINSTKTAQNKKINYSVDDVKNADQYIEYCEPEFYRYNGEKFSDFINDNCEGRYCRMVVFTPEERKNAYTLTVTKGENGTVVYPEHFFETYGTKKYKKNSIKTNIEKTISRYADSGMVYICEYEYIKIGVVCDKNDMPKYVVCRDSHFNFDKRRDNVDTDNEEIIKLLDSFDTLYNSYDRKVYDDKNKYQYVFDFDFFVDVDKAVHGVLPDDYVYKPHGLETMAKNTIKTIDGRAYRFSKYGICTGLYTGWSDTKNGKRFYRRGSIVTGKTTINGKTYEFDKKGYLKK